MKNVNKFIVFLFFNTFFLHFVSLSGQTNDTFRGIVVDSATNNVLESVVCKITDINKNVLSYCFSDDKGQFVLGNNKNAKTIVFEALGYKTKEIHINFIYRKNNLKIILEEQDIILKEIAVTAPPITKRNDTISYNVGSFLSQEDEYLGDILKKLPGIKVDNTGAISYQGESISKFYIEGRDLLGGQYNMATNNLSVDAITQVQVLENNQHIKALKGIDFADKAAINIKLKKSFIARPFGEIQKGIGFEPLFYNEKLFASQLGSKFQSIINLKVNNIGENIINEMTDKISVENLALLESQPEPLISQSMPRNLRLPESRYYFNRSNLSSINNLIVLSKNTELRTNFSFANNKLNDDIFSRYSYNIGNENLIINEYSNLINKDKKFIASAILEHNSETSYLKNEFKSTGDWSKGYATLVINEKNLLTQTNNNPITFRNNFHALLKYKGTKTIQLKSFIQFVQAKECLDSYLANTGELLLNERIKGKYLTSKNKINSSFELYDNRLDLGIELNYEQKDIVSDSINYIFIDESLAKFNFRNINSKIEEFNIILSPTYQIKSETKFITTIELPFSFRKYNINRYKVKSQSYSKLLLNPSLRNNYNINHLWKLNTRLSYDWSQANEHSLLSGSFFRGYRAIYTPSNTLNIRKSYTISSGLKYNNLIEMLFFNFNIIYSINRLNYMPQLYYTEELSYYQTIEKKNTQNQLIFNSNITKSFIPLKLTITISPTYTRINSKVIQNNNIINNIGNVVSLSLKSDYKGINNSSINYQITGRVNWNDNIDKKDVLKNLSQSLVFFYFPTKNIDLSINTEHTLIETAKNKYANYIFLDAKAKYKLKRFEFSINANNLFDKDTYCVTNLFTASSIYQEIPLRGREYFFSVSAKF